MSPFSKSQHRIFFYRLPVIALCIFIFWQSAYPGIISRPLFPHADKVLHFMVYALLAALSARSVVADKPFWSFKKIKVFAILFASAYGLSDEIHQAFVAERSASFADFIADCTGSIAGCFSYMSFISREKK